MILYRIISTYVRLCVVILYCSIVYMRDWMHVMYYRRLCTSCMNKTEVRASEHEGDRTITVPQGVIRKVA